MSLFRSMPESHLCFQSCCWNHTDFPVVHPRTHTQSAHKHTHSSAWCSLPSGELSSRVGMPESCDDATLCCSSSPQGALCRDTEPEAERQYSGVEPKHTRWRRFGARGPKTQPFSAVWKATEETVNIQTRHSGTGTINKPYQEQAGSWLPTDHKTPKTILHNQCWRIYFCWH